jgi:predicted DNA-binding protein (MmcQ/YjbR family)
MTKKEIHEYLLSFPNSWMDFPFGEDVAVYKIGHGETDGKMFALVPENKMPLRISLKCDPQLAEKLREKYESVMPGYHLNKKHWNTIICSGQLSDDEIRDLIVHSYNLVAS